MDIKRIEKQVAVDPNIVIENSKVSDLKSTTRQHDSDSYEAGKSDNSKASSSSTSAEPEKKPGQITGGILATQLTQARLGSGLHKDKVQQGRDLSQQQELGTDQQNAAASRDSELKEKAKGRQDRSTGTSSRDKDKEGLRDYLAQHGFDTKGGGGVSSSTGSGSGSSSTVGGNGRMSEEDKDKLDELTGGSSGPPSAEDKKDAVSAGLDKQKGYGRTKDDIVAEMQAATHPDAHDGKSRVGGYSKNMIADETYWNSTGGPLSYTNKYHNKETGEDVTEHVSVQFTKDIVKTTTVTDWEKDGERTGRVITQMEEKKNSDGSKTVTVYQSQEKDGKTVLVPVSTYTTGAGGSAGGKETTEEEYAKQQGEKLHQEMKKLGAPFGIDPHALPKQPHFSGDGSDERDAIGKIDLSTNVVVRAGGEGGMVGQPGSPDGSNSGGGGGFSTGGNIDYQDKSGYKGTTRTEEPSDVDTTPGMDTLNLASRDNNQDEDEEKKTGPRRARKS